MAKTIYGIFTGAYSDWVCIGYCTDREEAEKRVAKRNKELKQSAKYYYDDEYIMPIKCLDGEIDISCVDLFYIHNVLFLREKGSWKMTNEPNDYRVEYYNNQKNFHSINANTFPNGTCNWIMVTVGIHRNGYDRKLAEKIAQDVLYAYLNMEQYDQ